ncbi:MAG: peptidoglycan DD-metalloendopeptidase family protein [Peptostreptococcaceae bacterium]|nr:peptidoglycan DD-metalloendopeptidase family protein [Peptostreptococcaceae bacterium]MDY5739356.1 peptidoglycan DD-metalloendopeptidase family protein [Anaerovoracaceae bacterium]
MKSKKIVALALSLAVALTLTIGLGSLSYAETISTNKSKLAEVNSQKQNASSNVEEIQSRLKEQQKEVDAITSEVNSLESEIASTEAKVEETKVNMAERKEGLDNRLRAMYKNGSVGFVDVLLSSRNVSEFLSNVEMIKKIYSYDQQTLDQLKADHEFLEKAEAELKVKKEDLVAKQKEATEKANELENERANAQARLDSLTSISSEIESQIAAQQAEIDKQIAAQQAGGTTNNGSTGGTVVVGNGTYIWPTQGVVTSPFGPRPNFYGDFHTGIDIANSAGTPIVAAAAGTVIGQGQDSAGGEYIIIYHGNGMSTAYWHMMHGSIAVSKGQSVQQGQHIASMGSTGWSTGPHLHFEVRVNGSPVNPMGYL